MSHPQAFLQAIFANPDDDAPRLIYADWLAENGEPAFAEFIRVQCEIARLPEENDRWLELKIREEELQRELQNRWAAYLSAMHPYRRQPWVFTRGLLCNACLTVKPELFARESHRWIFLLDVAHLEAGDAMCDAFFACPQLARVRSINCERSNVRDSALAPFAGAGHFHALQRIDFFRNYIGPEGISALARCPSLTGLAELLLDENKLGDEGVQTLAPSPVCRNLTTLTLNENGLTDAAARAIALSPHLANLRALRVANNHITRAGAQLILQSPNLPNLCQLDPTPDEWEDDE